MPKIKGLPEGSQKQKRPPQEIDGFKIPKWWECGWRRISCGKSDCLLCGKIMKQRQKHLERGEDPDDLKSVFEDVGNNFKEALTMIKKDAEARGIDITNIEAIEEPPEPDEFPLYKEVSTWRSNIEDILKNAWEDGELWVHAEAAADLSWYKNTLAAKTYRQLTNRWHVENGDEYGDFDYKYTRYVLSECLTILIHSLSSLASNKSSYKAELALALGRLSNLKGKILSI